MSAVRLCVRRTGSAAGTWRRALCELVGERRGARRKRLEVEHLVGSGEIAERLGIRRVQTVHWWRKSDATFAEPVAVLGAESGRRTYIWYWPDVEAWAVRRGFTPGRS